MKLKKILGVSVVTVLLTKTDFNKTEKNILQWRNKSVEILKNILNEGN